MSRSDRRKRLQEAQQRLSGAIHDPATNPNMIPQLTGQLVAIERRLDRLDDRHAEESLPDPEEVGFVDLLSFEHWLRGPHVLPRRAYTTNEWVAARNRMFEEWVTAGFELTPRAGDTVGWEAENRARLVACLGEANP